MSKVFEFHFNPPQPKYVFQQGPRRLHLEEGKIHRIPFFHKPQQQEALFNTFCFFPETRQENKLGVLYLLGEMKNVLSSTQNLLTEIANVIKEEYYRFSYETPQDCFRAALEKADQFLLELKRQNTDFLGNLNFTAIALTPDLSVSLSKVGNSKLFLLTGKNIFDVGDNFNSSDSPIKTFPNVIEGSLNPRDKIVVVTDQLFDIFYQQEIFHNLIEAKNSKQVKELFKQKKPALRKVIGCSMIVLVKKELPKLFLNSSFARHSSESKARVGGGHAQSSPRAGSGLARRSFNEGGLSFLQANFAKILFSILGLALLLTLGWLIF